MRDPNELLPPRPGEKPNPLPVEIPLIVYVNGLPIEMTKKEALSVISRIASTLASMEEHPNPLEKRK